MPGGGKLDSPGTLRATDAQFAAILSIAADAIISVDETHAIIHFNQGAEEIFGYSASEIVGKPLNLLIPDRYRAAHPAHMERFGDGPDVARRMGQRREIFGLRKGNIEFPAEASISKVGEPGQRIFTVVLRDITDRKRIEEHQRFLSEAGARLSASLDYDETLRTVTQLAIPTLCDYSILKVLEEGAIRRFTSRHDDPEKDRLLRGLETPEPIAWDAHSPAMSVLESGRTLVIDAGQPDHEEQLRALAHPAALGVRSVVIVPLRARQRVVGSISLMSIRVDRADAQYVTLAEELALRTAFAIENARAYAMAQRANREREEVLAVVSHDLRNPLSAIAMCSRVLMETPPETEAERRSLLETIAQSTELTNRLIEDLLDVSIIEAGRLSIEKRSEEVAPIIEHVVQMFTELARERQIALYEDVSPGLPLVTCDAGRIVQALANLLGNALKFTDAGGRVTVSAEAHEDGVVVSVVDTGAGIAPEHRHRIFERYWQSAGKARIRGSGLGLAIAKGIAEAHGGRMWVESTPGKGSTFSFTLRTT